VTGLPRSGSTLLCQLLAHHPDIYSLGFSSPLCTTLSGLRHQLSDSDFLLAQLDADRDRVHHRLLNAFRGFINGWFAESDRPYVVDKNRGWLNLLEMAVLLDPHCKMLVCVRELGQICGSIEAQHRKTLLLDFPDHLANLSRSDRAKKLFADDGVVGSPLKAIENVQDLEDALQQRLYYIVFEHLISDPVAVMSSVHRWLGLIPAPFDPQNLTRLSAESDSYYRYKYPHQTRDRIHPPPRHTIPTRFETTLRQTFPWYYETFYPGLL
ncbi:MAG: sulfotransferase, partial [Cyanobacteria bacterium J06648_11]